MSHAETTESPKRTAVIVIHGIGEQQRNQTRDILVEHLCDPAKLPRDIELRDEGEGGSVELSSDMTPAVSRRLSGNGREADFYELYWAPLMSGQANFVSLCTAFIRDTLAIPAHLRHFPGQTPNKKARDVGYTAAAIIVLFATVWLSWWLLSQAITAAGIRSDQSALGFTLGLRELSRQFRIPDLIGALVGVYCVSQILFQIYTLARAVYDHYKRGRKYEQDWRAQLEACALFTAVLILVTILSDVALLFLVLAYVVFRGLTHFLQKWVVNYLGDIQVYCTYHETDAKFQAREKVLARSVELIRRLHDREQDYDRVVIVAHSLGTVIALDTLWRLSTRYAPLKRITGLITCGTALEKVAFLLRMRGIKNDPHWFYGLSDGSKENPAALTWINCWYPSDIVANHVDPKHFMDFGPARIDPALKDYRSPNPFWTHSNYFCDPAVLKHVCDLSFTDDRSG